MNAKEFWDVCLHGGSVAEEFDKYIEFFSESRLKEFENYDYVEIAIDIQGELTRSGDIDKFIQFDQLLREHNPEIYAQTLPYYAEFFVSFYYASGQRESARPYIEQLAESCRGNDGSFSTILSFLIAYDDTDAVNAMIEKALPIVTEPPCMEAVQDELVSVLVDQTMFDVLKDPALCINAHEVINEKHAPYLSPLKKEFTKGVLFAVDSNKSFTSNVDELKHNFLTAVSMRFMLWMEQLGFSAVLSSHIMKQFLNYWYENAQSNEAYALIDNIAFNDAVFRETCDYYFECYYSGHDNTATSWVCVGGPFGPFLSSFLC